MMMETVLSRSLRLMFSGSMAVGLGFLAQPAFAQELQADSQAQRVEITGSSIKRIVKEGALPVQQISKEAIARSGATTVADLIQKLPAMQGFTIEAIAAGTNSGGRTSASIHDIGSDYTLVLLNGRRIAPQGDGSSVNLNAIPMSAIERVEVLTDGASALYGSDAIAGVINFILKKNQQGGSIEAEFVGPQHSGGRSWNANATYGFGNIDENGYNVLFTYRHDEQARMKALDRPFAKTSYIPFQWNGNNYIYDRTSTATIPANVTVSFTDPAQKAISFSPYLKKNGSCPSMNVISLANSATAQNCSFDFVQTVEIVPESKRDSFFTSGHLKLGQDVTLFADVAISRFDLTARIAPNTAPFTIATSSQYYKDYVLPNLTPAQAAVVKSASGNYRAYDWGTRDSQTITDSRHLSTGVEADVAGWNVNSALTLSRNAIDERYVGGYMLNKEFRDMLANRSFDPFAPIGAQSDATKQLIANSIFHGSIRTASTELHGIDLRASRELFNLPGGNSSLGVGADHREYHYEQTPSAASAAGLIYNFNVSPAYDMKRDTTGLFGEFLAPVMKDLELTAAARYDTYTSIKDSVNNRTFGKGENATTYKLSVRYQPTQMLLLRGSYGTGFKAPNMLDIAQPLVNNGFTAGQYNCPIADNNLCRPGKTQYNSFSGGNENLRPEKSTQYTVGFRLEPTAELSFGAD
ncbi:TonB-dependent receptor plug domain-containing protein, partial [Undibacterium sp.]|uniref:TonB-dependent receptor plug domain-containing protein n=1 Tax=Undibacterium sp. TaxID=1914977 RepID=UPI002CE743A8